jgi:hypothetical protein
MAKLLNPLFTRLNKRTKTSSDLSNTLLEKRSLPDDCSKTLTDKTVVTTRRETAKTMKAM